MSRGRAGDLADAVNDTGAEVLEVGEFDLAIAHLNAPEMA
ncbi:hypothetical protein C1Y40_05210 [Mycobacterium talmoniae]|uniref:Uncharacterized protein n=1 Tax=Mycobacterium talmoniae TaxID=1858794 RepID=A0A2S8BDC4_9MYCO|nr:hypothetical protein C1Y40_05210 [Mycobacterium talmoniae]